MWEAVHSVTWKTCKRLIYYFLLTKEEFKVITSSNCHYCGTSPQQMRQGSFKPGRLWDRGTYAYNGIDRVDNKIGYILTNCVPCCIICNKAKSTYTQNDFLSWLKTLIHNAQNNKIPALGSGDK